MAAHAHCCTVLFSRRYMEDISDPIPIIIQVVGFWIIAGAWPGRSGRWLVNGLRTKMTVWLIAGGEWWENMEDKMRALTYYQHKSGFYQIKKIISYGSAWMNWEVFSVEHYDQRKNILNHTPPLNKRPSQSHRIILWPSKSLRISQPFHLENSPKNSWREYSWVIWCFGPLGKFRFLWHSNYIPATKQNLKIHNPCCLNQSFRTGDHFLENLSVSQ